MQKFLKPDEKIELELLRDELEHQARSLTDFAKKPEEEPLCYMRMLVNNINKHSQSIYDLLDYTDKREWRFDTDEAKVDCYPIMRDMTPKQYARYLKDQEIERSGRGK